MKTKIITLIFIASFLFLSSQVNAEEGSPSAQPTQKMEDKIKLLVQENLSTTEAKLKEKLDLQTLVGFVGNITTISSNNLTIDSQGSLLQITTTAKTIFLKDKIAIKFTSFAIEDKVIIIGTSIKTDIIQAKKITVIKDEPNLVKTTAIVAKITGIDIKKKTITLSLNETDQTLTLSKKSTVKLDDFEVDQTILGIIKEYNGAFSISRAKTL